MNISYIRVSHFSQRSTDGRQSEDAFPVQIDKAYIDHGYSGSNMERPALKEMLSYIRQGDHIFCLDISRLARSLKDFSEIVEEVTSKGCSLSFVKEGLTVGSDQSDPCQKLFVQIVAAMAEWELSIQKQRRSEGIKKAMEQNRYAGVGRKKTLSKERIEAIKARIEQGESITKIANSERVSRTTIYAYCK